MSYECCGSGEAAAAAASDALTASLSVVLRLLRFVYDNAGEAAVYLCNILAGSASDSIAFIILFLVVITIVSLIYVYLWFISGRIVISLSKIRDWLVWLLRGWKPIGETAGSLAKSPRKVQRVAPSLGTNARRTYYVKAYDENGRSDGANDDVSSSADAAFLACNSEADGAAADARRLRRVKERSLSGQ